MEEGRVGSGRSRAFQWPSDRNRVLSCVRAISRSCGPSPPVVQSSPGKADAISPTSWASSLVIAKGIVGRRAKKKSTGTKNYAHDTFTAPGHAILNIIKNI